MTVQEKIKLLASRIEGTDYFFMNWSQANVVLDRIERPTIVYVLPASGSYTVSTLTARDNPTAQIAFLSRAFPDMQGLRADCIVEDMKMYLIDLVREINRREYFEPIEGTVTYQVVYDTLDAGLAGIIATLPLVELEGLPLC